MASGWGTRSAGAAESLNNRTEMNLDWTSARARFSERFDAVVMLTASDWSAEPRSNRYHYATRFARVSKVIFVQPDRMSNGFSFSHSGVGDLEILHVPERFDQAQANAIGEALEKRNIRHPLIWTYSPHYADVIQELGGVLSVFHATEDFFQPELRGQLPATFYSRLTRLLNRLDLLVVVSEGVRDSYVQQGRYRGEVLLLENGCDFEFWLAHRETLANRASSQRKTAFYQGGINYRLDVDLIAGVARKLPDWEFRFCGARDPSFADWKTVRRLPNVVDLGFLSPEEVAKEAWRADVGIIPFIRKPFIVEKSLPLKAFEYVACDLPVVSVPIRALERWPELFAFAETPEQFSREMLRVAETKPDPEQTC